VDKAILTFLLLNTSVLIMTVPALAFLLEDCIYLSRGGCSQRYL